MNKDELRGFAKLNGQADYMVKRYEAEQSLKRELVEAFKKVHCNSDDCTKAWRKCPECNLITRAEATL